MRIPGIRRFVRVDRGTHGVRGSVDDEIQFHFDMTVRDLISGGMTPEDARRQAERRFGNVQRTRERLITIDRALVERDRRAEWWSAFTQDLRYAIRGLRLKPGFAIAVVATLGLGIGANATMFTVVDRLLFRPPAYLTAPDRASRIYHVMNNRGKTDSSSDFGYRRFLDLRENTTSFDAMTPAYTDQLAVGEGASTQELLVGVSNADLWKMFDIKPVIGRFFTEAENAPPDGSRVVVLSYGFWQTDFGGRRDVLGSMLQLGSAKYTIIGVAPEGFDGFETLPVAAYVPIAAEATARELSGGVGQPWYSTYRMTWFEVFARRKADVAAAVADADLANGLRHSYEAELAADPSETWGVAKPRAFAGPVLAGRGPRASAESKVAAWLAGFAVIVLLIACANVANLLVARALRRQREIAVRLALGVSRSRLLVQLIVESTILALLGGVAGVAVAQWGGAALRSLLAANMSSSNAWTDHRVLVFSMALVFITGLLTGLTPALHAVRTDIAASLKTGSREGAVQRSRIRAGLLIVQAALSVVLLVGAGLFVRSLANVEKVRLGFDYDQLLWVKANMRGIKQDSAQSDAQVRGLRDRSARLPGVEGASVALSVPFWSTYVNGLFVEGIDSVGKLGEFSFQAASPEYFATMGTRIVRGRAFTAADRANSPRVAVVSKAMGERLWPGQDAVGKCIRVGADTSPCTTVIGVAEDMRLRKLDAATFHYFMPIDQYGSIQSSGVFVRVKGNAADAAESVRRGLQSTMPGLSYVTVTPMSTVIGEQMRSWKLGATMFVMFGGLALVLAAIGLYSVIAYNVTQRTHEMGVRIALGAQSSDVTTLIVREGLFIVLPGVAIGALLSLLAGTWIAPLLFGVSPKDPPVMACVVATLVVVAVAASWLPALRASRVDPNVALRSD